MFRNGDNRLLIVKRLCDSDLMWFCDWVISLLNSLVIVVWVFGFCYVLVCNLIRVLGFFDLVVKMFFGW